MCTGQENVIILMRGAMGWIVVLLIKNQLSYPVDLQDAAVIWFKQ